MDIDTSYNFRKINDKLTTSGLVHAEALRALASQGYEVLVNLLPDTHDHAVPNEQDIVASQGLEYIYIPVDFNRPEQSDFKKFAEVLDRVQQKTVHVHCAANYRVSAFYALYEFSHGRWDAEQAMAFMQSTWQPMDHPGWSEFIADILGEGAAL